MFCNGIENININTIMACIKQFIYSVYLFDFLFIYFLFLIYFDIGIIWEYFLWWLGWSGVEWSGVEWSEFGRSEGGDVGRGLGVGDAVRWRDWLIVSWVLDCEELKGNQVHGIQILDTPIHHINKNSHQTAINPNKTCQPPQQLN